MRLGVGPLGVIPRGCLAHVHALTATQYSVLSAQVYLGDMLVCAPSFAAVLLYTCTPFSATALLSAVGCGAAFLSVLSLSYPLCV